MKTWAEQKAEDARCRILIDLDGEPDGHLSDKMLIPRLEAWGFKVPGRDWVRTQLVWLETAGAITLIREPTFIATITEAGTLHRKRSVPIIGVRVPERGE